MPFRAPNAVNITLVIVFTKGAKTLRVVATGVYP